MDIEMPGITNTQQLAEPSCQITENVTLMGQKYIPENPLQWHWHHHLWQTHFDHNP